MRVIALTNNEDTALSFETAAKDSEGLALMVKRGEVAELLNDRRTVGRADVMVVDVNFAETGALEAIANFARDATYGIPLVATASEPSVERIRLLMRLGVVDFLPQPVVREDFLDAVGLAASYRSAAQERQGTSGKIISFVRPSGGMGATSLAIQSAYSLANDKDHHYRTLLVDFDLQNGNATFYLDIKPTASVLDCLVDPERIDADLVSSVVIHHRTGFDMVPAPIEVAALDAVSLTSLERLLWVLREQYEVVIVDTPSAWVPWTDLLLSNSDEVVMVTEMTVAGVRQARKQLDALRARELGIDDRISIVANRYDKAMLGGSSTGISMKESEKALSQPFAATIPADARTLQRAVNDGITVPEVRKRTRYEKSVKALMTSILEKIKQAEQIG